MDILDKVILLRHNGLTFEEVGRKFGHTRGWAWLRYAEGKKKNRRILDGMVQGLLKCPKLPLIEKNPIERLKRHLLKKMSKNTNID